MNQFFKDFGKYYIGIETTGGRKHCIRGWYQDCRMNHDDCPRGYNTYEFRESDDGENYLAGGYNVGPSKMQKTQEFGARVMSEDEFKEIIKQL